MIAPLVTRWYLFKSLVGNSVSRPHTPRKSDPCGKDQLGKNGRILIL